MCVTFVTGLVVGVQLGLVAGMVISIGILLEHSAYPDMAILEKSQYGTIQHSEHWEKSKPIPNTCMVRIDASLFFTNVERFKSFIITAVSRHDYSDAVTNGCHKWLLIDFKGVNDIDFMGLDMLDTLIGELDQDGISLVLANLKGRVVRNIEHYKGLRKKIGGAHHLCISMDAAVKLTQTWTPSTIENHRLGSAAHEYRELASQMTNGMASFSFSLGEK